MENKDEILSQLKNILSELFEIDPETVHPEATLYDELDLDSIDAIDLVVKLQEMTGKKVKPEEFKNVRTVQDVVDSIYELVKK